VSSRGLQWSCLNGGEKTSGGNRKVATRWCDIRIGGNQNQSLMRKFQKSLKMA
jgi:hypothetical protein